MNSKEIFSLAIGLSEPWFIREIELRKPEGTISGELNIYIDFKRGSRFVYEGIPDSSVHDTVERKWQHLNFFQHNCYLNARVPRIKLPNGKVKTIQVPWARKGSGFTLLFEAFSMLLIESEMPVSKASKIMRVFPQRLWNIFTFWINRAHMNDKVKQVEKLGFDETSTKRGHNYVTLAVDLEERRVLFATEGKGHKSISETASYLESKSVDCEKVKQVCIDMSPAFISGVMGAFEKAAITFDKFHVTKEVNKAMDELRKLERKENEMLKGHKYTFLKKPESLSPDMKFQKQELLELYPKLGEGYRLKELFSEFWDMENTEEAGAYLAFWCDLARESQIQPFIKAANTIKAHWSGIVNYIESKINNGILEGINSKVQLAKKRARGYKNINNFINMIYFTCGKLKFDYPQYSI